ncbi:elongation factor G [Paenibacillus physcomitrellae]|uniref:Elongation factor G n=1 Tax=Paenibacillus physcomitrellae TaxID=1619311 RepID=A0ABQ1FP03_9BACL|nr:TetM/TetW/TetO/TetS family tetracycline resistance ribosomal protection protein [Paenibacillus physcomitrellae]GGA24509.1 elongation factor G [Paenibacillus physcomitrellae]
MYKTIGLFAHVDAGKTTLAEQLLFHTGAIKQRGRVDHRDAYLDNHEIEKARGITVFADQAILPYKTSVLQVIDTPGHVDFSPEMERAIQVLDGAVVILSAVEGVQGHTETVWQLLRKHQVPTFLFINKLDRTGADKALVLEEIRQQLTGDAYDCTASPLLSGGSDQRLEEFAAERDERYLDAYLSGSYSSEDWLNAVGGLLGSCRLFPVFSGSALQDEGIEELLEWVDQLLKPDYEAKEAETFAGRVYKIRHDDNGVRTTYLKVLSGRLRVRDEVAYDMDIGGIPAEEERSENDPRSEDKRTKDEATKEQARSEKITQIRLVSGHKFKMVDEAAAGQLIAVTGLSEAAAGQGVGALRDRKNYDMVPALTAKVFHNETLSAKEVLRAFRLLEAEDPTLKVLWEEQLQEIHIHVMGVIQLEVLEQLVKERFGLAVSYGQPEILYKETIANSVRGYGHFEPLRHYAEVHLKLEPGERGSGITFVNACHVEDLTIGNQNLIRHHLLEREHHGLLTGSPLTDVRITLLTGRAHNKHTHGGDFREASFRALRQGLEKADNVLLEPYYDFRLRVSLEEMGRVLSDIQLAHGTFEPPLTTERDVLLQGRVPVATFLNYPTEFAAITHGKGSLRLTFGGYGLCHNAEEVIARLNYDKNADPMYTSSSIFCAKGAGFSVPWEEAERMMHIEKVL